MGVFVWSTSKPGYSSRKQGEYRFHALTLCCTALVVISAIPTAYAQTTLPSGGQYVAGSGNIGTVGNTTTINQSSTRGIINWNSFSIGAGGVVNFNNGSGATLNRVTGGDLSQIDGQLNATGSVYLINPNGVVVGAGGKVVTNGSFVASTRDMANDDFMNGTEHFTGSNNGDVVNLGTINSKTGDVALIGHGVINHGDIDAPNGIAVLAAGDDVYLHPVDGVHGLYIKPQSAKGGDVTTDGQVKAAAIAIEAAQGNVYALAGNHGGLIEATGTATKDGQVWLMADNGTTDVGGTLHAQNADGTGGSIETSGHNVHFEPTAQIATGLGGSWLIDPENLTIDATAAGAINTALGGGTDVDLQTTGTTASGGFGTTAAGDGDIDIDSALNWSTGATLTLDAFHSVNINAPVTISGGGGLTVNTNNNVGGTSTGDGMFYVDMTGGASVQFTGGAGAGASLNINGNAYTLLYSMSDVQNINNDLSGNYALATSQDASSVSSWVPVGATSSADFRGSFNGLGNSISNLSINLPSTEYVGLFGYAHFFGIISNIALQGGTISGGDYVGALLGHAGVGTLYNVHATSDVSGNTEVGGLVGYMYEDVVDQSSASGTVSADSYVGGLAGYSENNQISNTHATGDVTSTNTSQAYAGGLLGYNLDSGSITGSYATGTVTGNGAYIGGLIGDARTLTVTNSYATGNVSGLTSASNYVGGLIGYTEEATTSLTNTYATGDVSNAGGDATGGLVGLNYGNIDSSYATGDVTSSGFNGNVGGLVGLTNGIVSAPATISNSYATGTVTKTGSNGSVGGLIGYDAYTTITNSHATGQVNSTVNGVGGLLGDCYNCSITNSYATGDVVTTGSINMVGGLVGDMWGGIHPSVADSYASGTVNGYEYVGGLVGEIESGTTIDGSHATGDVSATYYAGGLVGYATAAIGTPVTISNSYATGAVTSNLYYAGGLAGGINSYVTVSNAYATGDVTAWEGYAGGLVGDENISTTIENSYATGDVSSSSQSYAGGLVGATYYAQIRGDYATGDVTGGSMLGGLVGNNTNTPINTSYATGAVTGTGDNIGGLIGYNQSLTPVINAPITDNYATGNVSGNSNVGGFIGYNEHPSLIANDYATGAVTASYFAGGFIGRNETGTDIANSYATGAVSGPLDGTVGGLIGQQDGTAALGNLYYDTTTTGQTVAIGSGADQTGTTGLTTLEWLGQNPLDTGAFNNVDWAAGYPYPVLKLLPYITINAQGKQTQGKTDITTTISTIQDQNGADATNLLDTTALTWLADTDSTTPAGTYNLGGTGATAAGYQMAYTGSLKVAKQVAVFPDHTGSVVALPLMPSASLSGNILSSNSNGLAPIGMIASAAFTPMDDDRIVLSSGLGVYAATSQILTSSYLSHDYGIQLPPLKKHTQRLK